MIHEDLTKLPYQINTNKYIGYVNAKDDDNYYVALGDKNMINTENAAKDIALRFHSLITDYPSAKAKGFVVDDKFLDISDDKLSQGRGL
jgi:hypothetical protein